MSPPRLHALGYSPAKFVLALTDGMYDPQLWRAGCLIMKRPDFSEHGAAYCCSAAHSTSTIMETLPYCACMNDRRRHVAMHVLTDSACFV